MPDTLARGAYRDAVVLGDADIAALVPMSDAVEALQDAFRDEAAGRATTMSRTRIAWEGGRMQSLGGYLSGRGCAAVKSWVVTRAGAQPTVLLFSIEDGRVLAVMEAVELGRIRTGAASGVAICHMAAADASTLLVVGTGRQAMAQVAGALCVRDFAEILIAGRDVARTATFAAAVTERFGVEAQAVGSVAEGAARADVITTVTNARSPVLTADDVRPGTHVNAVGAIVPGACEVDPAIFARAGRVAVDSVSQAQDESTELLRAVSEHGLALERVEPLHAVVATERVRPPGETSVFKSLGIGLEDAAVAELAWRRSRSL